MARIKVILFLVYMVHQLSSFRASGQQTRSNDFIKDKRNNDIWNLTDSINNFTSSLSVGSYYDSEMVFLGRDFGEKQSGTAPYIMYNSAMGFYMYVIGNYWSAYQKIPIRTDLGIGFETILTEKIYVALGYERWISRYEDDYYNSLLTNSIELDIGFDLFGLDLEATGYYMFGEEYIFQSDIQLAKRYSIFKSRVSRISLKPSMLATFATRTFIFMFTEFYSDQINYNKFRLVDYEASATLEFEIKNLQLEAMAHYNVPVGAQYEELSPFHYFSLHLNYSFPFTKKR
jgi:hypothetical protein